MKQIAIVLFAGIAAALAACSTDGVQGDQKTNQPPNVWLSAGPPEGSVSTYRVNMFWGGWDPDGQVKGYEYYITNNATGVFNPADTVGVKWHPVSGNDSTFTFSADEETDSTNTQQVTEFRRSHTFFIRAIDMQGLRSRHPAHRSFTARTLSPEVIIDIPRRHFFDPALVPPIATFRWHAKDYADTKLFSQDPDSVQSAFTPTDPKDPFNVTKIITYLLSPAGKAKWSPFKWYKTPQDSGKFWTTPITDPGYYVFAVRAKDDAGAVTPVLDPELNVRFVKVGPRNQGPVMSVTNDYIGIIRTVVCSTPTVILDSPAGVPLSFKIQGDASSYGGTVVGYRYGWDIPDLNDPEQWEIDLTPFVGASATVPGRAFFFGTHTLTTEVVDNSGYCSRIEVKVNIVQFTLEKNLLVVDDDNADEGATSGWANGGIWPNDAEHDAFWVDMASEVAGFDSETDMLDTRLGFIPLATIAQYKSIIWDVYGDVARNANLPLLYTYIHYRPKNPTTTGAGSSGKVLPNVLALAMAAGSHIMISGNQPVENVLTRAKAPLGALGAKFPFIFLYEEEGKQDGVPVTDSPVGDQSFGYRELCLETLDYSVQTSIRRRGAKLYCPIYAIRPHGDPLTTQRDDTMRGAIAIDPNFLAAGDSLNMYLRPEAAAPGKFYDPAVRGLDVEVYNPEYFRLTGACQWVPAQPRTCFQPIYGLDCFDTLEPTYHQPIAFFTSAFADRVADVPGAVGAPSVVFGFPPVFFRPDDLRNGMDYILFNKWMLPRKPNFSAVSP